MVKITELLDTQNVKFKKTPKGLDVKYEWRVGKGRIFQGLMGQDFDGATREDMFDYYQISDVPQPMPEIFPLYTFVFWDEEDSSGISGKGDAAQAFTGAAACILDFVSTYSEGPFAFDFSAKESSRIRLYDTFSKALSKKLNIPFSVGSVPPENEDKLYVFWVNKKGDEVMAESRNIKETTDNIFEEAKKESLKKFGKVDYDYVLKMTHAIQEAEIKNNVSDVAVEAEPEVDFAELNDDAKEDQQDTKDEYVDEPWGAESTRIEDRKAKVKEATWKDLDEGDSVITKNNLRWEGQVIPKGSVGKILKVQISYGSNMDIYVIDFGGELGKFDFYPKDLRYLDKIVTNRKAKVKESRSVQDLLNSVLEYIQDNCSEMSPEEIHDEISTLKDYRALPPRTKERVDSFIDEMDDEFRYDESASSVDEDAPADYSAVPVSAAKGLNPADFNPETNLCLTNDVTTKASVEEPAVVEVEAVAVIEEAAKTSSTGDVFEWKANSTQRKATAWALVDDYVFEVMFTLLQDGYSTWPARWMDLKKAGITSVVRLSIDQLNNYNHDRPKISPDSLEMNPSLYDKVIKVVSDIVKDFHTKFNKNFYQCMITCGKDLKKVAFLTQLEKKGLPGLTFDEALSHSLTQNPETPAYKYFVFKNASGPKLKEMMAYGKMADLANSIFNANQMQYMTKAAGIARSGKAQTIQEIEKLLGPAPFAKGILQDLIFESKYKVTNANPLRENAEDDVYDTIANLLSDGWEKEKIVNYILGEESLMQSLKQQFPDVYGNLSNMDISAKIYQMVNSANPALEEDVTGNPAENPTTELTKDEIQALDACETLSEDEGGSDASTTSDAFAAAPFDAGHNWKKDAKAQGLAEAILGRLEQEWADRLVGAGLDYEGTIELFHYYLDNPEEIPEGYPSIDEMYPDADGVEEAVRNYMINESVNLKKNFKEAKVGTVVDKILDKAGGVLKEPLRYAGVVTRDDGTPFRSQREIYNTIYSRINQYGKEHPESKIRYDQASERIFGLSPEQARAIKIVVNTDEAAWNEAQQKGKNLSGKELVSFYYKILQSKVQREINR